MTQQQKRIKLAEFEGFLPDPSTGFWYLCCGDTSGFKDGIKPLPKYFEDLNSVRVLEDNLTDDQWTDYINNLYFITFKPAAKDRDRQAIHASAEQKCEALGKALNLW